MAHRTIVVFPVIEIVQFVQSVYTLYQLQEYNLLLINVKYIYVNAIQG